jgi:GntR family transcriptional regulator / MocR family aminotransferase
LSDVLVVVGTGRARASAIEASLRGAIIDGRLGPGTRLPSSRALAAELGCARATVVAAYEQLVAEGYLLAKVGAGTTVASVGTPVARDAPESDLGVFTELLPGEPDPSSFPRRAWSTTVRKVMQSSPDSLFNYGDRQGLSELRVALAGYLARSRSVVVDPGRVVIFGGFASALSTLSATFAALGIARVAVEDPGLPPHVKVVRAGGVEIVPASVDHEGICIDDLGDSRAVLCTPAHQFPTGVVMSATRRARLIEWAREHDAWVVEDDYDGEFRYDRRPIGAMQGLDPDRVVYGGTASKTLAPGLGIAWLVLPPSLLGPVLDTKRLRRDAVSTIEQAALAEFIASGNFDRHIRSQRLHYRRRRDALVRLLASRADLLDVTGVSAGLHVTAFLRNRDERDVLDAALRRGIAMFGLGNHRIALPHRQGLVIGYSRSPAHAFPAALDALEGVLDAC